MQNFTRIGSAQASWSPTGQRSSFLHSIWRHGDISILQHAKRHKLHTRHVHLWIRSAYHDKMCYQLEVMSGHSDVAIPMLGQPCNELTKIAVA